MIKAGPISVFTMASLSHRSTLRYRLCVALQDLKGYARVFFFFDSDGGVLPEIDFETMDVL